MSLKDQYFPAAEQYI